MEALACIEELVIQLPQGPFSGALRSRYWAYRLGLKAGELSVMHGTRIYRTDRLTIGPGCSINSGVIIDPTYSAIHIGRDVLIGPYTVLRAANHIFKNAHQNIQRQGHSGEPIIIGDDVWLGAHVTVLAGINIGRGCVVGAGSVVTKNFEPFSVVAGVPAKQIGYRH